jgi:hypothetical protein
MVGRQAKRGGRAEVKVWVKQYFFVFFTFFQKKYYIMTITIKHGVSL